jgi:phage baseplate assembly protein W
LALKLNTSEIVAYSDLDLNFTPNPLTGDLTPLTNTAAIRRSVVNLVLMDGFDIPFDYGSGSNVKKLLFEPSNELTAAALNTRIEFLINKYETRAVLQSVATDLSSDGVGYNVTVTFLARATATVETYTFFVSRVR